MRNNRGIDDGHDLPTNYLSSIYESIASTPIRLLYPYDNMPGLDHGSFYSDEEYWVGFTFCSGIAHQNTVSIRQSYLGSKVFRRVMRCLRWGDPQACTSETCSLWFYKPKP